MAVDISKELLAPYLLFSRPVKYTDNITLYPITMKDILEFQTCISSLTIRKDSLFPIKEVIKMSYLDFLFYSMNHPELSAYGVPNIEFMYMYAVNLLSLACKGQEVVYGIEKGFFKINGELVTSEMFDDIRKIILLQNDVDFDMDEFIHKDTLLAFDKAQEFENKKRKESFTLEDYIDSLIVALHVTEDYVENLSIRKFWRAIKRISKREDYQILRTAECGGMVTFKEPIKNWMCSLDVDDKYENLKTDEGELRSKITG